MIFVTHDVEEAVFLADRHLHLLRASGEDRRGDPVWARVIPGKRNLATKETRAFFDLRNRVRDSDAEGNPPGWSREWSDTAGAINDRRTPRERWTTPCGRDGMQTPDSAVRRGSMPSCMTEVPQEEVE